MKRRPLIVELARWVFHVLVPSADAEFVLGDLDEQVALRLRNGEMQWVVYKWQIGQLARSLPPIWSEHLRGMKTKTHAPEQSIGSLRSFTQIVRDAGLNLKRAPGRAVAVIGIMALGIGANATMFGALDRLFLQPPDHIEKPNEVRRLFVNIRRVNTPDIATQTELTYPDYQDWRGLDVFASTAAYSQRLLTAGAGGSAQRIPVTLTTASFFGLLGVRPHLGRFYDAAEDTFGAAPVAVLGHNYWQREFGGDPDVIGQTLHLGDVIYTIVGVTPPMFTGVDLSSVDVWLPLHRAAEVENGGTEWSDSRGWYWVQIIARLAPNVEPATAEAAATLAHTNARSDNTRYLERQPRVEMASLILARTSQASAEAKVVPWVMGVALMVLLLTCANVANILLASGLRQQRDRAVRLALGASRSRLISTVAGEAILMSVLGGIAAVLVAVWGGDVFRAALFPGVEWARSADAIRVVGFSAALALLAGIIIGFIPATRVGNNEPAVALAGGGRSMTRGRSRLRAFLLIVQAAISVVSLIGTGLFVLSLNEAKRVDLGFNPDGVLLVTLQPEGGYPGGEVMTQHYRAATTALEALPGTHTIAITTTVPFRNSRGIGNDLRVPGVDSLPTTRSGGAYIHAVTGNYFTAAGHAILQGRGIDSSDDSPSAPRVAVVNETMARLVWPNGDALGSCMLLRDAPCATVVGIASDSRRFGLDENESMNYYVPLAHAPYPWPPSAILIRSEDPMNLAPVVQQQINERVSGVRLVQTLPFRNVIDPTYRSWQLGASLFAGFGILALLVASIGLYSVLAFDVAQQRRDIGLRSALGASKGRIIRSVVANGVRLSGFGIALGLLFGYFTAPFAGDLLFGISPRDPSVLVVGAGLMLMVSVLACWIPAWRAAGVDPNDTLRAE